ncbi:MAG: hypothetical protein HY601_00855 [Candidatus Omnitrophica bacterium]|nr:hypothetical protein [Candidatus Omnitrophota bacterium]
MSEHLVSQALGILLGGVWNLASLWCLARLLAAWLGPGHSTRRALGWLLVKFPALYALAFLLWQRRIVEPLWFGVGFTLVLVGALITLAARAPALSLGRPHGR